MSLNSVTSYLNGPYIVVFSPLPSPRTHPGGGFHVAVVLLMLLAGCVYVPLYKPYKGHTVV